MYAIVRDNLQKYINTLSIDERELCREDIEKLFKGTLKGLMTDSNLSEVINIMNTTKM